MGGDVAIVGGSESETGGGAGAKGVERMQIAFDNRGLSQGVEEVLPAGVGLAPAAKRPVGPGHTPVLVENGDADVERFDDSLGQGEPADLVLQSRRVRIDQVGRERPLVQ